ncbi:6-phospho-3-hexuloisomerase [Bacillus songklensis]|uniref:6-phospho-3-hexuloisomerase n=1 Tax=Bacillus songklensis TaxID=1069116 RepID=A0ABV8AZ29_9BACI
MKEQKRQMLTELEKAFLSIKQEQVEIFVEEVARANRIFIYGLGRERLMLQAFAMRLMHLGLKVHVVGDVTTPKLKEGDLFVASSGTGYLATVEALLKIVKRQKASVLFMSANTEGPLMEYVDHFIHIEAQTMKDDIEARTSLQPMGALFEQAQLLLFELVVVLLKERLGVSEEQMEDYHTNLE